MSVVSTQTLQRLGTAKCEINEERDILRDYKSGAQYEGQVVENKKCGSGKFTWPNGASYEGFFSDNKRDGKGN